MFEDFSIGIMQGRLSNKPGMPLQSFPWNSWREEFSRASAIGFNQIEWLIDGCNDDENPIASVDGRKERGERATKDDISIKSLCAHSLIDGGLLDDSTNSIIAQNTFSKILSWAFEINIEFIILPIMDAMSIQNNNSKEKLKKVLRKVVTNHGPTVLLESDLPAASLKQFIDEVALDNVKVLYDLGNATAMGFDIESELRLMHSIIGEVHIKDRFSDNGGSERLGMADTPFHSAVEILRELSWSGSFILETPIFNNWKDEAEANFYFTRQLVNSASQNCKGG